MIDNTEYLLKELGFIYDIQSGFQFDLNTVLQKTGEGLVEGHWCNNSCTTDCGSYNCPAAFSNNQGSQPNTLMSFEEIKIALTRAKSGLEVMNKLFLETIFPRYTEDFKIPGEVAQILSKALRNGVVELNIFGGNPELHPDFIKIIKEAKEGDWRVTTTTTGKKFLHDSDFSNNFLENPPHLLALSADDYEDIDELKRLLGFSLQKLKKFWQKANPLYGQRKKAYESIYVAKLAQETPGFCPLLFNMVVHPGNVTFIEEMMNLLHEAFPTAIINPYPAQSSFSYDLPLWEEKHLRGLERFIDSMIKRQITQVGVEKKTFVPRLQFWLFLKSVFLIKPGREKLLEFLSGSHLWRCYQKPGAGRYLQAGSSAKNRQETSRVGGHPGCFWNNKTVTDESQLWLLSADQIADYILEGKTALAKKAEKPCPGCIMPRLLFDGISTELGMSPKLVPTYLKLRKDYFKF